MIGSSNSSGFTAAFTAACAMKGMQGMAAATAAALAAFAAAAFAAANVMDGIDGGMVAPPPCLSFLLGVFLREGCDDALVVVLHYGDCGGVR